MSTLDPIALRILANCIRALAMDAVEKAQSGHPGQPMGMADVATVLFTRHLKFYAHQPAWPDRDRLILSGGHGSMLLYALGYLTGYQVMTIDEIKNFRQLGSITPGHLERHLEAGVEMTTGPLGQGLASGVGFALAERMQNARYGDAICQHKTYVLCGDGDLQEGVSHEASALAGHLCLKNLIILYDDNNISIDGPTDLSFTEDVCARYDAYGWATRKIDGHDAHVVDDALAWAKTQDKPVFIACKTTIGFGAGAKAGTAEAHGSPLGTEEIKTARANLNWPHAPFVIPDDLLSTWRNVGSQGRDTYTAWEKSLAALDDAKRQQFIDDQNGVVPHKVDVAITAAIKKFTAEAPVIATRKASQLVLEHLVPALPNLIGGSADLTGSNLTKVKNMSVVPAKAGTSSALDSGLRRNDNSIDYTGQYIYYGVREHGMAAVMNGIALHGGFVPYGGTFLCFADYARPSIRLAALMGTQSIFVMTHDSIGLGEDGPTHQPIEHLASLRAMPNVLVLRPADAIETAQCWHIALHHRTGPSVLCLTRQNVFPLPLWERVTAKQSGEEINNITPTRQATLVDLPPQGGGVQCGAHIIIDTPAPRVVICATGSEVGIAIDVATKLAAQKITARVVSIPSFELFRAQDEGYKQQILMCRPGAGRDLVTSPDSGLRRNDSGVNDNILYVAIEAGVRQGWDEIIGTSGLFFGMNGFGASAPAQKLYDHFGLNAEMVAKEILVKLA